MKDHLKILNTTKFPPNIDIVLKSILKMGKYHRKRKMDTTELEKEVVPYDYITSLAELRRKFDEVKFIFLKD